MVKVGGGVMTIVIARADDSGSLKYYAVFLSCMINCPVSFEHLDKTNSRELFQITSEKGDSGMRFTSGSSRGQYY